MNAYQLWEELGDVPVDDDGCIDIDWYDFPKRTDREEIWHWFEDELGANICDLMHGIKETP